MRRGPRPTNRPWTPEEDAQLLALLELKMERPLIARKLKRTVPAINIHLRVLKAKMDRATPNRPDARIAGRHPDRKRSLPNVSATLWRPRA